MPDFIHYKGCVPAEDSTRILRQYFALLFPTKFPTEGIPGTIIDGYAAGTPVISAKWNSFADVVDDGKTGIGFEQLNINELMDLLNVVALNPDIINSLRANCLKKAEEFTPSYAKELILRLIG